MVSLDTTRCREGGKWRQIDSRDIGEDVTALIIARSSCAFVFLERPDPSQRLTVPSLIHCCQHRATTHRGSDRCASSTNLLQELLYTLSQSSTTIQNVSPTHL
ncbi:hypothetical protein TNCV_1237291 [Trichonephila clavipes]|nr:hypothetical protein TNCV_1237291 [Trichonephila clavipes]